MELSKSGSHRATTIELRHCEALLWAVQSETEEEKRLLFELVLTWTQAAFAKRPHWDPQPQYARTQSPVRLPQ